MTRNALKNEDAVINRMLEIIENVEEYKTFSGMGELEIWVDKDELIEEIKALKGGDEKCGET